jgi:hypothetical protein
MKETYDLGVAASLLKIVEVSSTFSDIISQRPRDDCRLYTLSMLPSPRLVPCLLQVEEQGTRMQLCTNLFFSSRSVAGKVSNSE